MDDKQYYETKIIFQIQLNNIIKNILETFLYKKEKAGMADFDLFKMLYEKYYDSYIKVTNDYAKTQKYFDYKTFENTSSGYKMFYAMILADDWDLVKVNQYVEFNDTKISLLCSSKMYEYCYDDIIKGFSKDISEYENRFYTADSSKIVAAALNSLTVIKGYTIAKDLRMIARSIEGKLLTDFPEEVVDHLRNLKGWSSIRIPLYKKTNEQSLYNDMYKPYEVEDLIDKICKSGINEKYLDGTKYLPHTQDVIENLNGVGLLTDNWDRVYVYNKKCLEDVQKNLIKKTEGVANNLREKARNIMADTKYCNDQFFNQIRELEDKTPNIQLTDEYGRLHTVSELVAANRKQRISEIEQRETENAEKLKQETLVKETKDKTKRNLSEKHPKKVKEPKQKKNKNIINELDDTGINNDTEIKTSKPKKKTKKIKSEKSFDGSAVLDVLKAILMIPAYPFIFLWKGLCYIGKGISKLFSKSSSSDVIHEILKVILYIVVVAGVSALLLWLKHIGVFRSIEDFFNKIVKKVFVFHKVGTWWTAVYNFFNGIVENNFILLILLMIPEILSIVICFVVELLWTLIAAIGVLVLELLLYIITGIIIYSPIVAMIGMGTFVIIKYCKNSDKNAGNTISMILCVLISIAAIVLYFFV